MAENTAEPATGTEEQEDDAKGELTSPEGILMLCTAGFIDVISFIPAINWVSTILGVIIFGGWLIITRPGKAIKIAVKRLLIACGIEVVPIVSIAPAWTWFVYKTLKEE